MTTVGDAITSIPRPQISPHNPERLRQHAQATVAADGAEDERAAAIKQMRWIAGRCDKLRHGTDDWFELVDIAHAGRAAISAMGEGE